MLLPLATSAKNSWVAKFKLLVIKRVGSLTDSFFYAKNLFFKMEGSCLYFAGVVKFSYPFPTFIVSVYCNYMPYNRYIIWSIIGFSIDPGCQYDANMMPQKAFILYFYLITFFHIETQPLFSIRSNLYLHPNTFFISSFISTVQSDIDYRKSTYKLLSILI